MDVISFRNWLNNGECYPNFESDWTQAGNSNSLLKFYFEIKAIFHMFQTVWLNMYIVEAITNLLA